MLTVFFSFLRDFARLLFSLGLVQSLLSQSRELSLARETAYKYSKQLLARQLESCDNSDPVLNGIRASCTYSGEYAVSGTATPAMLSAVPSPSTSPPPTSIMGTMNMPTQPPASSLPLVDRTHHIVNKSAPSLVDMLGVKTNSNMTGANILKAPIAQPNTTPSLLTNLINRTK